MHAAIAQLDRVTDYESVGRGFESLLPYQKSRYPFGYLLFCFLLNIDLVKLILSFIFYDPLLISENS